MYACWAYSSLLHVCVSLLFSVNYEFFDNSDDCDVDSTDETEEEGEISDELYGTYDTNP